MKEEVCRSPSTSFGASLRYMACKLGAMDLTPRGKREVETDKSIFVNTCHLSEYEIRDATLWRCHS